MIVRNIDSNLTIRFSGDLVILERYDDATGQLVEKFTMSKEQSLKLEHILVNPLW